MKTRTSLNGDWQFQPLTGKASRRHLPPGPVPIQGWSRTSISVPGSWTDGGCPKKSDDEAFWLDWKIVDSCETPKAWHKTRSAWYRRAFDNPAGDGERAIVHLDGALRCAWVCVNGRAFAEVDLGAEARGLILDIDLEMGWNTVLIFWRHAGGDLHVNWRTRQGEPEVEFDFAGKPWDAA